MPNLYFGVLKGVKNGLKMEKFRDTSPRPIFVCDEWIAEQVLEAHSSSHLAIQHIRMELLSPLRFLNWSLLLEYILGRVIFLKTCFDFRPDDVVVLNRQLIYREFYPPEYLDELGIKDRKAKSYLQAKRGTSSVSGWSDNSWQQNTCTALWAHFGLGVWKSLE